MRIERRLARVTVGRLGLGTGLGGWMGRPRWRKKWPEAWLGSLSNPPLLFYLPKAVNSKEIKGDKERVGEII